MSITLSNCNEICNSPLNSSKAKMLYTFPKGQRFNSSKKILYTITYIDVTDFTIFHQRLIRIWPLSATVISMTSPKGTFGLMQRT
jgi:hypothetical protein